MSVSIKQLKAFVAVVEEKSFSQAAERLNATQSGMSMLVQNLEMSIGKKLLDRIPGNMRLTESGKDFYKYSLCTSFWHCLDFNFFNIEIFVSIIIICFNFNSNLSTNL